MKKLLGILVLGLLWCTNSFSQNCDPNQYNDGIQLKDAEKEWNYSGEKAYAFGRKIQEIVRNKDIKSFIKLTTGDLKQNLENKFKVNSSFENFFTEEQYNNIIGGDVYCFPLGSIYTLQFWIGLAKLEYTKKEDGNWVVLKYR